jgi:threonine dehydratase
MTGKPPRLPVTRADIDAAASTIAGEVLHTPSVSAPALAAIAGTELVLKLETLHPTGSFKERGALTKLKSLSAAERRAGIIAMSAGNHAQAVAYHAKRLHIPATIVMPADTPFTKIERTERLGARIVLEGAGLGEARIHAAAIAAKEGLLLIHPYDDPLIIAGQGTAGLELMQDRPGLDVLIVPVGGGGLISGIAIAAKSIDPKIAIIGVECAGYASMLHALHRAPVPKGGMTLAEGIAVKEPGKLTRRIVAALVDDILLAAEDEIERAVALLLDTERLVVEGAGAASLAALLANKRRFRGKRVGLVVSGGNIDARLLSSILQRALARAGKLVRLRVEITDQPGALAKVTRIIADRGGNIVEIYHQRLFHDVPVKLAEVDAVVETRNAAHVGEIIAGLVAGGLPTRLLSSTAIAGKD